MSTATLAKPCLDDPVLSQLVNLIREHAEAGRIPAGYHVEITVHSDRVSGFAAPPADVA